MAFAITLRVSEETGGRLRGYWSEFARFEAAPSMESLGLPPHITLAVYDEIDVGLLRRALAAAFDGQPPLRLVFRALRYFETPRLVFWAAPEASEALSAVHERVHRLIDPRICRAHYRTKGWVPHATVATDVAEEHRAVAIARAAREIEPFEVVFDQADCVEFLPVRVIDSRMLSGPPGPA